MSLSNSFAFFNEEQLPIEQEERARELFMQVRCLVCEGQVIGNSDSEVAIQLRGLIRREIKEGKNDQEIKSYLVSQYGQNIITDPPLNLSTFLLWLLPVLFIINGVFFVTKRLKVEFSRKVCLSVVIILLAIDISACSSNSDNVKVYPTQNYYRYSQYPYYDYYRDYYNNPYSIPHEEHTYHDNDQYYDEHYYHGISGDNYVPGSYKQEYAISAKTRHVHLLPKLSILLLVGLIAAGFAL